MQMMYNFIFSFFEYKGQKLISKQEFLSSPKTPNITFLKMLHNKANPKKSKTNQERPTTRG